MEGRLPASPLRWALGLHHWAGPASRPPTRSTSSPAGLEEAAGSNSGLRSSQERLLPISSDTFTAVAHWLLASQAV